MSLEQGELIGPEHALISNRPKLTYSTLDIDLRVTNVGYDTYSHENKIIIKMS